MTCLIVFGIVVVIALFLLAQATGAGKTEHSKPAPDDRREF